MKIEVKREGTLLIMFVNEKPVGCSTMHTFDERRSLFGKAREAVKAAFELENRTRTLVRQAPVTFESFVKKVAGPNVRVWCIADGSQRYPYAWPDPVPEEAKPAIL